MKFSDNERVDRFLNDLQLTSPDKLDMVESIREVFKLSSPELHEDIKYGGVIYNQSDALIGGIFPYTGHISIEFSHGASLPDPDEVLEGKGKYRRHIKIRKKSDIKSKNTQFYVKEAINH